MADIELLKRLAEASYEAAPFPDMKKLGAAHRKFYAKAGPQVVLALIAENEALQASLDSPDELTAEPALNYDDLRRQFLALRSLANSKCRMAEHWRKQSDTATRETLLANSANVNAERDTNALLTDALEAAEVERDRLKAALERLRDDHDKQWRLAQSGIHNTEAVLAENARLRAELERARAEAERYQYVRRLDPNRFGELWQRNIQTGEPLDGLVDAAMGRGGKADG